MKWFRNIMIGVMSLVLAGGGALPVMAEDGTEVDAVDAVDAVDVQLKGNNVTYKAGEKATMTLTITNNGNDLEKITIRPFYSSDAQEWPFKEVDYTAHTKTVEALKGNSSTEVVYNFTTRDDVGDVRCCVSFELWVNGNTNNTKAISVFPSTQAAPKAEDVKKVEIVNQNNSGSGSNDSSGGSGGDAGGSGVDYDTSGVYNAGGSTDSSDSTNGSVPRVIVTGFTTEPGTVKAGSDFKLVVHLKNTSKKTAVSNMVLDFSAPTEGTDANTTAPAFLPTSGSNTIYIERIKAEGTMDVSLNLNAKADLVQKPYGLDISMKYEDSNATQHTSESSISVPVKQDARFEFSEIEISPESISPGGEANVMCSMYNLGRIKLYNVKASFEGEGIKANDVFVGNVESGATASIDGMITGEAATSGDGKVKMIVTYEDEGGNISTVEEEFTLFVAEEMTEEMFMEEGMEVDQGGGTSFLSIAVIAVLVVIAAVVIIIIVRKRKKAKQKGDGLEDELDRLIEDE
ncbi:MAG: COG1361 S-layer family protein [Lachnospiraceae bacterium]